MTKSDQRNLTKGHVTRKSASSLPVTSDEAADGALGDLSAYSGCFVYQPLNVLPR
jgi:hypothetical protein